MLNINSQIKLQTQTEISIVPNPQTTIQPSPQPSPIGAPASSYSPIGLVIAISFLLEVTLVSVALILRTQNANQSVPKGLAKQRQGRNSHIRKR